MGVPLPAAAAMKGLAASSKISAGWMDEVASSPVLGWAFAGLCQRRVDYADSADVWNVRRPLARTKTQIQDALLQGQCHFQPLRRIQTGDGECIELWAALDALGLKALAIVIGRRLDFPRSCYHVAGKNGQKRGGQGRRSPHLPPVTVQPVPL